MGIYAKQFLPESIFNIQFNFGQQILFGILDKGKVVKKLTLEEKSINKLII